MAAQPAPELLAAELRHLQALSVQLAAQLAWCGRYRKGDAQALVQLAAAKAHAERAYVLAEEALTR